jgi:hypothetical protein
MFAMAESFFLDGGSRLDNFDNRTLATVSERRSVALLTTIARDVGRYPTGCGRERLSG